MCIGIPMKVIESGFGYAQCEGMGVTRQVDTLLVGTQPPGTWLLVFLNSAREVLTAEEAAKISDAVKSVDHIMSSNISSGPLSTEVIDSMFSDLVNREPPKPPSLIALEQEQERDQSSNSSTNKVKV